ncbi:hypothetical protein Cme02nite_36210 [Catellatospora methionotrophica]|uniref:DUF4166 domain-containing protein n=1 Tax=Catellatospora methionotrophica TaxID=121620 RepID=A0A8J3PG29_9ACTN|nr:DUF4166 domain-containing protein [Catellatospora methionotrophica]GIG15289.1 hypothetical protein Cme02nite_36210 [Catellatospora methionotrophica]
MNSLFHTALGADFDRLHPRLRERFGFTSTDGRGCVGNGVMDRIWRGRAYTRPFLALGALRNIMFPEQGRDVPFTIENYAYTDTYGRETLTFVRTFELHHRRRRFDATMVWDPHREVIVDYLGTHQHIAADLHLRVDDEGGLHLRSGQMRLRAAGVDTALPTAATAVAEVHERYDDTADVFRIDVRVTNPWFGPVFGYTGAFTLRHVDTETTPVPASVKPYREQARY